MVTRGATQEDMIPPSWSWFAGEAGLTRTVERRVGTVFNPADIQQNHFVKKTFNLLCKTAFKELKKKIKGRQIRWVHLAPPCKTFSRARRRDRHAKARILRTRTFPGGLWPRSKLVQEANVLASRSAQIAALQHKANGWVPLENPAGSFIWEYGPVKRLLDNPDMKLVFGVKLVLVTSADLMDLTRKVQVG